MSTYDIFCSKSQIDIHIPNFLLNGETLPRVSKYTYLGHIITEDLCDSDDISRQYKSREFILREMP